MRDPVKRIDAVLHLYAAMHPDYDERTPANAARLTAMLCDVDDWIDANVNARVKDDLYNAVALTNHRKENHEKT